MFSWLFGSSSRHIEGQQHQIFGYDEPTTSSSQQVKGPTVQISFQNPPTIQPQQKPENHHPQVIAQPGVAMYPSQTQVSFKQQQPIVGQPVVVTQPPVTFQTSYPIQATHQQYEKLTPNAPPSEQFRDPSNQQPFTHTNFNPNFQNPPSQPNSQLNQQQPFTPKLQTSNVIGASPVRGIHYRRKQYDNGGITVNRKIQSSGNAWSTEREYQTGNLCFRVNGSSNIPFSGLIMAFGGNASECAPPNHTHYLVFNNQLQQFEKRVYPNGCPPSSPQGKYMLVQRCIIPYRSIVAFEVDCSESHINRQYISHLVCVTDGGLRIPLNKEEIETVEVSTEKAEVLYQAMDYSVDALEKLQQYVTQPSSMDINPNL